MDWLTELLGIGANAASGGVFGLIGAVVGQVSRYFQESQRQAWELKKWSHEEKLLELQMKVNAQETENELAIVAQEGSWDGLKESYAVAVDQKSYRWVAAVKSLFRPFITVVLWMLAAWVFYKIVTAMGEILEAAEIKDLVTYMVYSVFFTTSTATMWWFGDRALTPTKFKNQ